MCGICCILSLRSQLNLSNVAVCDLGTVERASLYRAMQRRGPDAFASLQFDAASGVSVEAASAVLCLRGDVRSESADVSGGAASQPAMVARENCGCSHSDGLSSCQSFLQWNGEVFGGALHLSPRASDTAAVLSRLYQLERECAADLPNGTEGRFAAALAAVQALFSESCVRFFENEIEGPYAFVYYAKSLQLLLFGRDPSGRRSLLTHVAAAPQHDGEEGGDNTLQEVALEFVISSIAAGHLETSRAGEKLAEKGRTKRGRCEECGCSGAIAKNNEVTPPAGSCSSSPFLCGCWQEVPNTGLFAISVVPFLESFFISHYPWTSLHSTHPLLRFESRLKQQQKPQRLPRSVEEDIRVDKECSAILQHLLQESDTLSSPLLRNSTPFDVQMTKRYLQALWKAVEVRVKADYCGGDPTRPVGVLFSGGIDCTVLAAIAHYVLPAITPIELINVAFGDVPELAPDRLSTFRAFEQLLQLPTFWKKEDDQKSVTNDREWRLVLVDVPHGAELSHIQGLVFPGDSVIDMSIGTALWHASQGRGRMQRVYASDEVASKLSAGTSLRNRHKLYRLAMDNSQSFSVAEELIPTNNCVNDEARFAPLLEAVISEVEAFGGVPTTPVLLSTLGKDHATALRPVLEKYGYKKLGAYLNDASSAGVIAFARRDEVSSKAIRLVRPADLARVQSVTPAKWLVCDGESSPLGSCVEDYVCEARVLLLGIGADETLAGYTRHRRAFERRGVRGLVEELNRDFGRLWKRNLGRDDRVVSDSGREGRYPYLDEGLLTALEEIAAEAYRRVATSADESGVAGLTGDAALQQVLAPVCCFTTEENLPGVGDKKILRRVAAMLGLGDVVHLQKRAIQFGSRVAHAPC